MRQKSDKRIPKQDGDLKNHAKVVPDGGGVGILYPGPYGHYQYHGEVMAAGPPSTTQAKPLDHNQALCGAVSGMSAPCRRRAARLWRRSLNM